MRPGWVVQTWPLGWQLTHPGRITGTPTGACRRSPRREAPERAGEPDTAQVVGGRARLAADIATLETARVPTGRAEREVPCSRKRHQAGTHLFPSSQRFSGQVSNRGDPAPAASRIDSKPQVFQIHGPRLEVGPAVR